ncbi:hypothetical protein [Deinococcus petrolearius]|uniref:Fimbrial biogenesis outer membrane usher protein n=1 Tax=Deinococcus petrolearius TaxID=1751295 RepID=A0ABW1DPJ2_9DEIO
MTNSGCPDARPVVPPHRSRSWLWLALGLALGCPGALAQTGPTQARADQTAAVCAAPPALLDVAVGGSSRGAYAVPRVGEVYWIPADALTESEIGYGVQQATCPAGVYLRLSPEVQVQYDDQEQSLSIRPTLALLPGNVLDFAAVAPEAALPTKPLAAVTARVQASGQWGAGVGADGGEAGTAPYRQQFGVQGLYAQGRWDVRAGVGGQRSNTQPFSASAQLQAGYRFSPQWQVRGFLSQALLGQPVVGNESLAFSGLELDGQSERGIVLPEFRLDLPLDSEISLVLDDEVLREFRARAGQLVVRNLPVSRQQGELLVFISDLSGKRKQVIAFQNLSSTLGKNAYQLSARAGAVAGRLTADLSAYYGLTPNLVLRVLGTARGPGVPTASISGLYSTTAGQFRAGVGVQAVTAPAGAGPSPQPTPDGQRAQVTALLGYGLSRDAWTAGVDATIPIAHPDQTQLQANLGYAGQRVKLGLGASYTFGVTPPDVSGGGGWTVSGSALAQVAPTVQLSGQASATALGWRAGVGLIWTPSAHLSAVAGVSSALPVGSGSGPLEPTFALSYQATPRTTLSLNADRQEVSAGVGYDGLVSVAARVGTSRSYALDASAGVAFAGGTLTPAPQVSSTGLQVRTGVPGVTLLLDGAQRATTDRQGNAYFSGLKPGSTSVVGVDFDGLDFGTQVEQDTLQVRIGGQGLSVLDWTRNFRRVRWLQVFWKPGEVAAYATLSGLTDDAGRPLSAAVTDDQGNAQLTRTAAAQTAVLIGENGRTCRLEIAPEASDVTCTPP